MNREIRRRTNVDGDIFAARDALIRLADGDLSEEVSDPMTPEAISA